MHINISKHILHGPASGVVDSPPAAWHLGRQHRYIKEEHISKVDSMADDTTKKPSQGRKGRPKFAHFPESSTKERVFPFSSAAIIHHEVLLFLQGRKLHSHWSWCESHKRINLHKAITVPALCLPVKLNEGEPELTAAVPWQVPKNTGVYDVLCIWCPVHGCPPPRFFCSLSKISWNFSVKLFFLYVVLLVSTSNSSGMVAFDAGE